MKFYGWRATGVSLGQVIMGAVYLFLSVLGAVLPYAKLAHGAFVAADNMTYPEVSRSDAARYQRHIRQLEFDSVLLPIGSGVELSRRH